MTHHVDGLVVVVGDAISIRASLVVLSPPQTVTLLVLS
jgi:hypothetical protein